MKNYFRDFIVSPINKGLQNIQNIFKTTNGSNNPAYSSQNHQERNIIIRLIISIALMAMLTMAVLWRPIKALFKMFTKNTDSSPVNAEEANTVDTPATESPAAKTNPVVSGTTTNHLANSTVTAPIVLMKIRRCGAAAVAAARATEGQASPNPMLEPR